MPRVMSSTSDIVGPAATDIPPLESKKSTNSRAAQTSALWRAYCLKGAAYVNAYEAKRGVGMNQATKGMVATVVENKYHCIWTKLCGTPTELREYMETMLGIPAASLVNGYARCETYPGKPLPHSDPQSTFRARLWVLKSGLGSLAYTNLYDSENGVILAEDNFAVRDKIGSAQMSIRKQCCQTYCYVRNANMPPTNLHYLIQARIVNKDTQKVMEEAHAHPDAPTDNVVAGWKKWVVGVAKHRDVIFTLAGTDNGKTSLFILKDWAGHLNRKSIVAVHTYIEPKSKAKHMCWEFSVRAVAEALG